MSEDEDIGAHVMGARERKNLQAGLTEVLAAEQEAWPSCMEIFCPGRFGEKAQMFGLRGAKAFDLSMGWDWKRAVDRAAVWKCLEEEDPDIVIMSPPC